MRSPSVSDRRLAGLLVLAASTAFTRGAEADDKQICADAYSQTQTLRQAGRLLESREQALLCVREVCPEFIRADCAAWLPQIEASLPSIVFDVRDASGAVRTDASVDLDGKPWLPSADVKAHPIDPGSHTLRITLPGGPARDELVVVREGERNKQVSVSFAPAPAPAPAPSVAPLAPTAPPPASADESSGPGPGPWIVGGTGVALLAVGGVLGIVVLGERSTFDEHCDEQTETCDAEGIAARDTGESLGPASTILMVLGAAGIATGAVWLAVGGSPDEPASAVHTGPKVGADGATWRVRGSF